MGSSVPLPLRTRRLCDVEGCGHMHAARGYCVLHYGRWRRNGSPFKMGRAVQPVALPDAVSMSPTELAMLLGVSRQRADQMLHREQARARQAVAEAVAAGNLQKPSSCARCDEVTDDLEAHHWDYRERLDIRWLCIPCHNIVHPHAPGARGAAPDAK